MQSPICGASRPSASAWVPPPRRVTRVGLGLLVALFIWFAAPAAQVQAQGFGVYEQGACAMARAGATVAQGCGDGSSLYFNPANIVDNEGLVISAGATMVAAGGDYTSGLTGNVSELQNDPIYVPHAFATYEINESTAAGLGVYVPYGLATEWRPTFEGAFEGYDSGVQSIYVQPTIAMSDGRLSIGGGPIVAISSVELNQRQDLSQQEASPGTYFSQLGVPHHTAFVDVKLEGHNAIGFGANIGATFDVNDQLSIATRFTTPVRVTFDGDATFTQIETGIVLPDGTGIDGILAQTQFAEGSGTLIDQSIETEITFPSQLIFGVSYDATADLTVLADYQWTRWSSLGAIPLDFEKDALDTTRELNYEDTHGVRLGAQYDVADNVEARAGFIYNTAAAPAATVTPLLPENDRTHYTVGLGYRPADSFEINAAYQYLGQADRAGRVRDVRPGENVDSLADLNEGLYSFDAHLVGLTLTVHL
ncbi:OmpP1/FadL family transporter [Longibacter salinarum]|nr:outer membrane protein transport protein [Longibacter salinarum]